MIALVLLLALTQADASPVAGVTVRPPAHVDLQCHVTAELGLERCKVLSERPADMGFGKAALRLSSTLKMKPPATGAKAAGAIATIPMTFKLAPTDTPPEAAPPAAVDPPRS